MWLLMDHICCFVEFERPCSMLLQAGCSTEAEELAAEVAAKQAELMEAQTEQQRCRETVDGLNGDIAEAERRLQVLHLPQPPSFPTKLQAVIGQS